MAASLAVVFIVTPSVFPNSGSHDALDAGLKPDTGTNPQTSVTKWAPPCFACSCTLFPGVDGFPLFLGFPPRPEVPRNKYALCFTVVSWILEIPDEPPRPENVSPKPPICRCHSAGLSELSRTTGRGFEKLLSLLTLQFVPEGKVKSPDQRNPEKLFRLISLEINEAARDLISLTAEQSVREAQRLYF